MDEMLNESGRLKTLTENSRLELLRTDLEVCQTLVVLVESELEFRNHDHAAQTLTRADKGYQDMSRLFEQRKSWGESPTAEIRWKLANLRKALDRLQPLVYPSGV